MFAQIEKLWRDERGSVGIEYAIIGTGIAVVIVSTVTGLGEKVGSYFTEVSGALK